MVAPNGDLKTLINFNGTNGQYPYAGLTLGLDGNFYGTTYSGGVSNVGSVFQLTTNGVLTTLASFNTANGAYPEADLTLGPDGSFYGSTTSGGIGGRGTLFKMTTNGNLTTLVNFDLVNGASPSAALVLEPDGNFYGTTEYAGANGAGTVFRLTPSGGFTTLCSFSGINGSRPLTTLSVGPDGNLYGTTQEGGGGGAGTLFRLGLPPDFATNPTNQGVVIGGSVTFTCQPFGTAPFSYQWLSNGIPIAGATNIAFTVPVVSLQTANVQYQVMVSNVWGSNTSSAALVNVVLQPNSFGVARFVSGGYAVNLGSFPNSTNRLWTSTNLALPMAQWQVIATNITDSSGLTQFIDTNTPGAVQRFYRLSYP